MQRRVFSQWLASAVPLSAVAWGASAQAQTALKEGTDYTRLSKPVASDAPAGQIEVLEFFAYSCIHCYRFEPLFAAWKAKQPARIQARRVPVAFTDAFVPMQQLYYALESMNLIDRLHEKVFQAIHVDKQRLTTTPAIMDWVKQQGVDMTAFNAAYSGFGVAGKVRRATQLQNAYQVEGTPSLGIAGRFYAPGQGPRTLVVADALIAQLR
jgi:thiol:disulfide interchange protein DsbA